MRAITEENLQTILGMAKEHKVSQIKVYHSKEKLIEEFFFIIELEKEASALEQVAFEKDLGKILAEDEYEQIEVYTMNGLKKNMDTHRITEGKYKKIIEQAIPIDEYVEKHKKCIEKSPKM